MKTLISILASMALALGATFAHADDHAAPSAPVGMVGGLDVSDPQAFATAMGKYWSSRPAKNYRYRHRPGGCRGRESNLLP